jgi:hypothetical protein
MNGLAVLSQLWIVKMDGHRFVRPIDQDHCARPLFCRSRPEDILNGGYFRVFNNLLIL